MDIRAEEISRIIRSQIEGFDAQVDVAEVGTVISVQMLSGATHIASFHSPGIGDYSILHTWPIPSADVPTDGSVSDYIAMRPGHTTVDAAAGSTHLLVTVTVTASSPTP